MLKSRFKSFLPAIVWAMLIFVVSSIPNLSTPPMGISFSDKVMHFGEYAILGFLTAMGFSKIVKKDRMVFLLSALCAGFYGVFDELHQYFVPGRYLEFWDIMANIFGAIVAGLLYVIVIRRKINHADTT